jgi:prevent-host-death family protein
MTVVTVHEAKTNLSKLIAEAVAGGDVVIAKGAIPAVRLVPIKPISKRQYGALKDIITIDDRFDEPLPDSELAAWGDD